MHTQEHFNCLVTKVAPQGRLQGFHIPYIKDLINMEPCTLWGKFLLGEREEAAFSGPQVRACMGQYPVTLNSKRAMQPLLEAGLGKEAAYQCGIRVADSSWLPFGEMAFTEGMLFSAAWKVQHRESLRRAEARPCQDLGSVDQEVAATAESIGDECSSPPTQTCGH